MSAYERAPLCRNCFFAWLLGNGLAPKEPTSVIGSEPVPCLICQTPTVVHVREPAALIASFAALSSQ